jgi:circadian clock protein KaiB
MATTTWIAHDLIGAPMSKPTGQAETVVQQIVVAEDVFYELTLFVSGASDLAARAVANATRLCELHCGGRYHLSVIDINEDPSSLITNNVLATPTLVKTLPAPVRRVVGDLSETAKVVTRLDLPAAPERELSGDAR